MNACICVFEMTKKLIELVFLERLIVASVLSLSDFFFMEKSIFCAVHRAKRRSCLNVLFFCSTQIHREKEAAGSARTPMTPIYQIEENKILFPTEFRTVALVNFLKIFLI